MNEREAAKYLGVTSHTLHVWQEQGMFESGLSQPGLDLFLERYKLKPPVGEPWSDIAGAITRGGVFEGVRGNSVDEVLEASLARLSLPAHLDRVDMLDQLKERERISSTGVGQGIAFPHVANPSNLILPCSYVAVIKLAAAVPFFAFDNRDVELLFLMLVPHTEAHLNMMQALAKAVRQPDRRERIMQTRDVASMANLFDI